MKHLLILHALPFALSALFLATQASYISAFPLPAEAASGSQSLQLGEAGGQNQGSLPDKLCSLLYLSPFRIPTSDFFPLSSIFSVLSLLP